MMKNKNNNLSRNRIIVFLLSLILAILIMSVTWKATSYYHATPEAIEAMQSTDQVIVTEESQCIFFDGPSDTRAFIFYPGGDVETESYAPLLQMVAEGGMDVFLVKMPLRLAIFGKDKATDILNEYNEYENWYIGGHSLGGAMAANYAADHHERFDGVILMAAYPTKNLKYDNLQVLSFYGTEDKVLNMENYVTGRELMPDDYTEIQIPGGNHAQFGNYGFQKGDGEATISANEQQAFVVDLLNENLY